MPDEVFSIEKAVVSVSTLFGISVAMVAAIWRRSEARADNSEKRISALENEMNKKVDFKSYSDSINAIREEIQSHSKESTNQIIQKFDTLNARMDYIFKIIVNKKD